MSWQIYALCGAVFASLTTILTKIGLQDIDSNLATAVRTAVVLILASGIVLFQGTWKTLPQVPKSTFGFLVAAGLATGFSWLFFFRALQMSDASKVMPLDKLSLAITVVLAGVILHEHITWRIALGVTLIVAGAVLAR
jgi:transporter family protein